MKHRTEKEMIELIQGVAEKDERIRAVWMNGSRANPKAHRDHYQDYDIVYAVREMDSFLQDPGWVDVFGERVIMQTRDLQFGSAPPFIDWYIYLMQLTDGNRIDLTLLPVERMQERLRDDTMCVLLMDKDSLAPPLPPQSDEQYWVRRPTEREFDCCCNEFWWVATYVVKGVWRQEMPYAHGIMESALRPQLIDMVRWKIGLDYNFQIDLGKHGRFIERYLYSDDWQLFASSYAGGSYDNIMGALDCACKLFRKCGREVGRALGYGYPEEDDKRVTAYLRSGGRFNNMERTSADADTAFFQRLGVNAASGAIEDAMSTRTVCADQKFDAASASGKRKV
jgi:aminoglycoside 6-adenylyltransferase